MNKCKSDKKQINVISIRIIEIRHLFIFGKLQLMSELIKIFVMKQYRLVELIILAIFFESVNIPAFSQTKGLKTITEEELRYNLEFLGAREFRGRETPSAELEIATLYIGNWVKHAGLKPLLKDGSFYQEVPLNVTAVSKAHTSLRVHKVNSESVYYFGKSFGGSFAVSGTYSGTVVFAGPGITEPGNGWDDLKNLDLRGKIVIIMDEQQPGSKTEASAWLNSRIGVVINAIRERGASAVLSVVSPEKEKRIATPSGFYDYVPTGRIGTLYDSQRTDFTVQPEQGIIQQERPRLPFTIAEISHQLAADILGMSEDEIENLFTETRAGNKPAAKEFRDVYIKLDVGVDSYRATSRNIIAVVEGSDPVLKNEYVVICGHHDGRGIDDGEIIPGADDNGTASVALMEIGQALLTERPKRSVILAWVTGEEQGMNGSHFFINNCPVPVEKISACLDMDMIGRNNTDSLYLVGSDLLSSELDGSIKKANQKSGMNFGFDYRYSNLTHPQRVYFRSDHYPFIRFGIPSVWFFCGFTNDYHTYRDLPEYIDYTKFLKTTKLVYATAIDIGNMKSLLRLDVNPSVASRGAHNLKETSLFLVPDLTR